MARKPLGYIQVTGASGTPIGTAQTLGQNFTGNVLPAGTTSVDLQAEAQNLRYTDDGTTPTTAIGMLLLNGQGNPTITFTAGQIAKVKFIGTAGGAIANISAYKD